MPLGGLSDRHSAEAHQGHCLGTLVSGTGAVGSKCVQQRLIAHGLGGAYRAGGLAVTVVADVAVIGIKVVLPGA
jgi:hypothetical protein